MIAFYISGHGFGHASRAVEILIAMARHAPEEHVVVRTAVPAWLFKALTGQSLDIQPLETDAGVAQIDSLRHDERETARLAARFYDSFDDRVAAEAVWLRANDVSLVVADIPPLALAAAARARIPSIAVANFTWDWIYRGFEAFDVLAPGVVERIGRAYATATAALRLPLHGGFEACRDVVRDLPFVARRSRLSRQSARGALGLDGRRPVVLASFGGHGVRLPYEVASRSNAITVLMTEFEAQSNPGVETLPNVRCLSAQALAAKHLRHVDLVAAADVVVSKPGYGIVSECLANGAALLYTSRGRFREYDVMVEAMPRLLRCRYIDQDALFAGDWAQAVCALLEQPAAPTRPMVNGADLAAQFILRTAASPNPPAG